MAQILHLDQLPESARNELIDFYEFLLNKYSVSIGTSSKKAVKKCKAIHLNENSTVALRELTGIWKGRDITQETLRKAAWQRQQ